jgi:hypothetical protein
VASKRGSSGLQESQIKGSGVVASRASQRDEPLALYITLEAVKQRHSVRAQDRVYEVYALLSIEIDLIDIVADELDI